jgi:ABC-type Zn uptake system ZnuABC Zn-binding protein ZnuA
LLPVGSDPHSFNPNPQDLVTLTEADVVFANGAGLETFLDNLIESAQVDEKVVHVSKNIDLLEVESGDHEEEEHAEEHEGEEHEEGHHHEGVDPHTWFDPTNAVIWVQNIESTLVELDSENADDYRANAARYEAELEELDSWIREQVAQIPAANRELVTDHRFMGYFAQEYGFEQIGALIPGYSSLAEPTAQEIAAVEDAIAELDVKAVFVGNTVNPSLAERVSTDTGTQLIFLYTGSLSEPDGDAGTYLDYLRYNASAIVDALK